MVEGAGGVGESRWGLAWVKPTVAFQHVGSPMDCLHFWCWLQNFWRVLLLFSVRKNDTGIVFSRNC